MSNLQFFLSLCYLARCTRRPHSMAIHEMCWAWNKQNHRFYISHYQCPMFFSLSLCCVSRCTRHPHTAWQFMRCAGHGTNKTTGSASVTTSVLWVFSLRVLFGQAHKTPTHSMAIHEMRGAWNERNRAVVLGLYDSYRKAQALRRNLSSEALKGFKMDNSQNNAMVSPCCCQAP